LLKKEITKDEFRDERMKGWWKGGGGVKVGLGSWLGFIPGRGWTCPLGDSCDQTVLLQSAGRLEGPPPSALERLPAQEHCFLNTGREARGHQLETFTRE